MDKESVENWQRIKDYFETLPDHKRDNMFYRRAVAICGGSNDPLEDHPPTSKDDPVEN